MSRRTSLIAVAPVAVALAIAGCGGSSNSNNSAPASAAATTTPAPASQGQSQGQGQVIKLSADPGGQLRFNTSTLTAKAGKVTLRMTNPASAGMDHGVSVEGNGVHGDGNIVAPGGVSTVTVTVKKGTYTFFCPVPGHEAAGMKGTLKVS
jgi:plastocyanin